MEKLSKEDGQSMDIVEHNIEQLKELFPDVFSEGKIQFDKLQALLGNHITEEEDNYNFTWHGKLKAGRLAQTPSTGTLRPCKDESEYWDNTQNLFIEGDNLEVLKLLQKSYHRQVKMIYIDPPYNTGNDFVYKDDFKDGVKNYLEMTGQLDGEGKKSGTNSNSTGRYHTNWLNMMYPRLKLARNLLRDDGVIFISIHDNEFSNLKKICDEVLGEANFVASVTWKARVKPVNIGEAKYRPQKEVEYVLAYQKKNISGVFSPLYTGGERAYPHILEDREYRLTTILKSNRGANKRSTMTFSLDNYSPPDGQRWQAGEDEIRRLSDEGYLEFKDGTPFRRYFKDEEGAEHDPFYCFMDSDWSSTSEAGKNHLNNLVGDEHGFDTVKPVRLIQTLIQSATSPDSSDVVLDFFAGSGTTGESVLRQNKIDSGNRKYILVQLPEPFEGKSSFNNVVDLTKRRIVVSAQKIQEENPDYKGDLGFKVFKLDTSNIKRWEADFDTLEDDLLAGADYIKQDRSSEDILYELLLKYGLDLTVPIETRTIAGKTVYSIGLGALVVCLEKDVSMELVNGVGALKVELQPEIMRVVFTDNGFKDDVVKTNAMQTLKRYGIADIKSL
jgi:adenine-specific DNA-methyltransferase